MTRLAPSKGQGFLVEKHLVKNIFVLFNNNFHLIQFFYVYLYPQKTIKKNYMKSLFNKIRFALFIIKEIIITAFVCAAGWILFKLNIDISKKKK